jgi:hypothetical protein
MAGGLGRPDRPAPAQSHVNSARGIFLPCSWQRAAGMRIIVGRLPDPALRIVFADDDALQKEGATPSMWHVSADFPLDEDGVPRTKSTECQGKGTRFAGARKVVWQSLPDAGLELAVYGRRRARLGTIKAPTLSAKDLQAASAEGGEVVAAEAHETGGAAFFLPNRIEATAPAPATEAATDPASLPLPPSVQAANPTGTIFVLGVVVGMALALGVVVAFVRMAPRPLPPPQGPEA